MKDQKANEIHGLLTDQQTNRENYNKEKLKSSHFENKTNIIEVIILLCILFDQITNELGIDSVKH